MGAAREIVVEVRVAAGAPLAEVGRLVHVVATEVAFGASAGDLDGRGAWSAVVPAEHVEPQNACRLCAAPVAWSALCSACCGLVERVREVISAAPAPPTRTQVGRDFAFREEHPVNPLLVSRAIQELFWRGEAHLFGGLVYLVNQEAA